MMPRARETDDFQNGNRDLNGDTPTSLSNRKRQRDDPEEISTPPCAQCRSRKVRCDRQQPNCSNCRRAGVPCEYSNSSSRAYNVKELLDAFSSVTSRLDRMEDTLAGIADYIKRTATTGPQSPPTTNGVHSDTQPEAEQIAQLPDHTAGFSIRDEDECAPGPLAGITLFKSLHCRLANDLECSSNEAATLWTLAAHNPIVERLLRRQLGLFPFSGGCLDFPVTSDNLPIQAPPRLLVEECVRKYIGELNVYVPMFNKVCVEDAAAFYYDSPPCQQVPAQALTLSNMYLLAVTLTVRIDRANPSQPQIGDYDPEMAHVLLANCDRALHDLDIFSAPTMENLKALLTLAFICQEYYAAPVYSRLCQTITRLARAIGLHKTQSAGTRSWDGMSENESIFWITYSMDKREAFQNSQPGELYLYDSTLPVHPCDTTMPAMQELNGAFYSLFTIWEDIHLSLYSARSTTADESLRADHIHRLQGVLSRWGPLHQNLITQWPLHQTDHLKTTQIELQYAFYLTRLLVRRCDTTLPPDERYRSLSQPALELLSKAFFVGSMSADQTISLGRIFRNYPSVAFHDFFLYTILSDKRELAANAELLHAVSRLLEPFCDPDFPESYYNKLYSGFSWCTNQLDILVYFSSPGATLTRGACAELDEMFADLPLAFPGIGTGSDENGEDEPVNLGFGVS
ncbi:hypothetical protein BJX76DRAFT_88975 [Aspergillus varians]